jgi:hypothetical protein
MDAYSESVYVLTAQKTQNLITNIEEGIFK